jgi:flagellar protein FliS
VNRSALQNYLTQQVMSASPAKLVAMLHDKAISSLQEAVAAIEKGDIQARHNANCKAIDVVAHLWGTLDLEQGGQIAENLYQIYDYMIRRLADVDFKNDPEAAREVIALLDPLRKSWYELTKTEAAPEAPGAGETPPARQGEAPAGAPSEIPAAGSLTISA